MKTPITRLIEELKKSRTEYTDSAILATFDFAITTAFCHLDIEKRNIEESFNAGEMNVWNHKRDEGFEYTNETDYYIKTYNQND